MKSKVLEPRDANFFVYLRRAAGGATKWADLWEMIAETVLTTTTITDQPLARIPEILEFPTGGGFYCLQYPLLRQAPFCGNNIILN